MVAVKPLTLCVFGWLCTGGTVTMLCCKRQRTCQASAALATVMAEFDGECLPCSASGLSVSRSGYGWPESSSSGRLLPILCSRVEVRSSPQVPHVESYASHACCSSVNVTRFRRIKPDNNQDAVQSEIDHARRRQLQETVLCLSVSATNEC